MNYISMLFLMLLICLANHLGLDRLLLGIFVPATHLIFFSAGWFPDRAGPGQLVQRGGNPSEEGGSHLHRLALPSGLRAHFQCDVYQK